MTIHVDYYVMTWVVKLWMIRRCVQENAKGRKQVSKFFEFRCVPFFNVDSQWSFSSASLLPSFWADLVVSYGNESDSRVKNLL